jgi:hypothetical protein
LAPDSEGFENSPKRGYCGVDDTDIPAESLVTVYGEGFLYIWWDQVAESDFFEKDRDWDAQGEIQSCQFGYIQSEGLTREELEELGLLGKTVDSISAYCKSRTIQIKGIFDASRAQDLLGKVITRLN